jgi:hypothetical protein
MNVIERGDRLIFFSVVNRLIFFSVVNALVK